MSVPIIVLKRGNNDIINRTSDRRKEVKNESIVFANKNSGAGI